MSEKRLNLEDVDISKEDVIVEIFGQIGAELEKARIKREME